MEHESSYNYLHFEIQDPEGKVRANLIATEHQVRPGDSQLNPRILEAIKSSSKAILEMLPNTRVISFSKADHVLENVKKIHTSQPAEPESHAVKELLAVIKGSTSPQNFAKVEAALLTVKATDKEKFLLALHKDITDFNFVSLEQSISEVIEKHGIAIKPLGEKELLAVIKGNTSPQNFAKVEAALLIIKETDREKFLLILRKNLADFNLASLEQNQNKTYDIADLIRRAEDDMKLEAKAENENRPAPRDPKVIMAEIHEAWRQGDGQTLGKLLIEEDPNMLAQIQEVMRVRDENIAKRIIDLVSAPQAEIEKPLTFMVGAGHLVDTRWKNVFAQLADAFAEGGDLSGWKIVQVESSPIKADQNEG